MSFGADFSNRLFRAQLDRYGVEHQALDDTDAASLYRALAGIRLVPSTPSDRPPIVARVWLAAALAAGGSYRAPERFAHPADLQDGQGLIDSVILMAIIQRHFSNTPELGWDDQWLAEQLGVTSENITRAQRVLEDALETLRRVLTDPAMQQRITPVLGERWWQALCEPRMARDRPATTPTPSPQRGVGRAAPWLPQHFPARTDPNLDWKDALDAHLRRIFGLDPP
jgi:hypothetical protein